MLVLNVMVAHNPHSALVTLTVFFSMRFSYTVLLNYVP